MGQAPVEFPKQNVRLDPFTQEDQSVLVSNEQYTIPAASPFYVQLDEVPRLDDPSTVTVYLTDLLNEDLDLTETIVTVTNGAFFAVGDVIQIDDEQMLIGGISGNDLSVTRAYGGTAAATHTNQTRFFLTTAFTEVLTTPTARQYQVHYGTTAIPYKAGLVRFAEAHASVTVWITYYKTGHYNWAEFVGNSVNVGSLTHKDFILLAESAAEILHSASGTWYAMKTLTFTTTAKNVLLWIEFEGCCVGLVAPIFKAALDNGSTIYSCGKWTGLAGNYLGDYTGGTENSYILLDNITPGKHLFEYNTVFAAAGNCPLNISGITPGMHTMIFYAKDGAGNQKIRNIKIYSTRL